MQHEWWSINSKYEDANHHPIAVLNGDETKKVIKIKASPGSEVELSAADSKDPDGDELSYLWTFYSEPSSYSGKVEIQNKSSKSALIFIPQKARDKNIHVILQITDDGEPNLIAFRRLIIEVE